MVLIGYDVNNSLAVGYMLLVVTFSFIVSSNVTNWKSVVKMMIDMRISMIMKSNTAASCL